MKKRIILVLLITIILAETTILYNQNKEISAKNKELLEELTASNLVNKGEVSLEAVKEEKQKLEEYTADVFKEESIKDTFDKNKEKNKKLTTDISKLENQVIDLEAKVSTLKSKYNKLLKEIEIKNTFYIKNVPFINQYPNYPTGCESVSLTILLKYYGVKVTPDAVIKALPKGPTPYTKKGVIYGGNPEKEFVGNPYSLNSFGVYEKPIAEVANKFKPGIKIATGTSFDKILEVVETGTPVMVWTSMYLAKPYISTSWIYKPTGERIYWKANEHAVVLIGYTQDKVIISDPIDGKMKYQSRSIFKERYNYFGKKALYYE